jgi:hypothetical protein
MMVNTKLATVRGATAAGMVFDGTKIEVILNIIS